MDIVISQRSDIPIYEQIRVQRAARILDGRLAPGEMLPSIRGVAEELSTSVITIKKAWELLEAEDLIYTRAGKGSYATAHPRDHLTEKRRALATERFRQDAAFYREFSITQEELLSIVEKEYR